MQSLEVSALIAHWISPDRPDISIAIRYCYLSRIPERNHAHDVDRRKNQRSGNKNSKNREFNSSSLKLRLRDRVRWGVSGEFTPIRIY